jgi:DNA polymerase-1
MGRVIIDGDSYVFKAAYATSTLTEIGNGIYYEAYDINRAREYMKGMIDNICDKCAVNDYVIVLGAVGSRNFRYDINPTYKANRKAIKKPIMLDKVRSMVTSEFNTYSIPCLEADDVVRILYEEGEGNAIASIDKDLQTFPCKIYDSYHDTFTYVMPQQADANFKRQLMIGDATDGYSGIPKVGKATADKHLIKGITVDDIIQMYLDAGLSIDDFKRTYNSAKILSKDDYNNGVITLYGGEQLDVRDKQKEYLRVAVAT